MPWVHFWDGLVHENTKKFVFQPSPVWGRDLELGRGAEEGQSNELQHSGRREWLREPN